MVLVSVRLWNLFIYLEKSHLLTIKQLSQETSVPGKDPRTGVGTFQAFNITEAKIAKNSG